MKADMDLSTFKEWLSIVNFVFMGLISAVMFVWRYDKSNTKRLDDLEALIVTKTAETRARLDVIDEKFKHVPSSAEMAALTVSLQGVVDTNKALAAQLAIVNEFLLKNK